MKLTILHTNDLHGHLAPWQGWEGDLKGRTIGGLGVSPGRLKMANQAIRERIARQLVMQMSVELRLQRPKL